MCHLVIAYLDCNTVTLEKPNIKLSYSKEFMIEWVSIDEESCSVYSVLRERLKLNFNCTLISRNDRMECLFTTNYCKLGLK